MKSAEDILRKHIPNFSGWSDGKVMEWTVKHSSDFSMDFDKRLIAAMKDYATQFVIAIVRDKNSEPTDEPSVATDAK